MEHLEIAAAGLGGQVCTEAMNHRVNLPGVLAAAMTAFVAVLAFVAGVAVLLVV